MENIIAELIDIESIASDLLKKAKQEQSNLHILIDEKVKGIELDIEKGTDMKVRELLVAKEKEIQLQLQQIEGQLDESTRKFEMDFEKNKQQWVENLINKVSSMG